MWLDDVQYERLLVRIDVALRERGRNYRELDGCDRHHLDGIQLRWLELPVPAHIHASHSISIRPVRKRA